MPCEIVETAGSHITVKISGVLKKAELVQAEKVAIEVMRSGGKVQFLLLVENFQGWDKRDDWGDLSFQSRHDEQIEKIAIVCEERWQEFAEVFAGKGHRSVEIRHFTPDQTALAGAWSRHTRRRAAANQSIRPEGDA